MERKEFENLKPGDKVRIVSEKTGVNWNILGSMDKWLGKIMTVRKNVGNIVLMKEDAEEYDVGWRWHPEMIDCVVDKNNASDVKNNASDVSAIYPAIEIISEHIHAIINVLTDLANQLDEINKE